MLYTLQLYFINKSLPYAGNDPYIWFNNVWFVHKYGFLDYEVIKSYTPGFVVFCTSMISFTNDYMFFYYFFKYIPLFLSVINLLVLFVLSKKIFKDKINIFFTLAIYLGFTIIFNRNNKPLPSLLAITLGFLFLLFLKRGTSLDIDLKISNIKIFTKFLLKNKKVYFTALLITGISLTHPLYGILILIFYFCYECYLFISRLKSQLLSSTSKSILIRNFFMIQFLIFGIFVLLMSIFVIGTSINRGKLIFESYLYYFSDLTKYQYFIIKIPTFGTLFRNLGKWLLFESFYYYINQFFKLIFSRLALLDFYNQTIQVGVFLIFVGLFLNYKKRFKLNEKQNTLINFFKFTFILTFIIFEISRIIVFFGIPILYNFMHLFFTIYRIRLFELFSGYWTVIFVLTFNSIVIMIKKKYLRIRNNKIPVKKLSHVSNISLILVVIFSSGFLYFANFGNVNYSIYFDEDQIHAVSFVGNYFEENPLDAKKGILLQNFNSNAIYGLIVDINLIKNYFNFSSNLNYSNFINEFNFLNCQFLFLNLSELNEDFRFNFSINFDIIFEGVTGYIFAKIK